MRRHSLNYCMNENHSIHPLMIIFCSKEESNCSLIPVLLKIIKKTEEKIKGEDYSFLVSTRYGKRVIMNSSFLRFKQMKRDMFIEIIDYNFLSHTLFIIGQKKPSNDVLHHWLLLYAKKEIGCNIEIRSASFTRCFISRYPNIKLSKDQTQMDILKSMMKVLQNNNICIIDSSRMLITSPSIVTLEEKISLVIEEWGQIQ